MVLEILIAVLIILILLVLFVSFHVMLVLDKRGEQFQRKVRIKWLFLSYSLDPIKFLGRDKSKKKSETVKGAEPPIVGEEKKEESEQIFTEEKRKEDKPPVIGAEKKEDKGSKRWTVTKIIKIARLLLVPALRLMDGILQAIDIHKLKMSLKFGFDDPADTGMVLGYMYALRGYLEYQYERVRLYAEPNFIEMMLDFNVIGDVKFRIANLLPAILRFIFNRDVMRVSWAIIRKKEIPDPS